MPAPDLIIENAEVVAPDPASAVAVTGSRITAMSEQSLRELAGPRTEVLAARGATLLPGFVDAHVHPLVAGVQRLTCDLSGLPHSVPAYRDAIRRYADAHPEREWISGRALSSPLPWRTSSRLGLAVSALLSQPAARQRGPFSPVRACRASEAGARSRPAFPSPLLGAL